MQGYIGQYPCMTCFHGQVKSCEDNLPNGCEYYYDRETGRRFPIELHKKKSAKEKRDAKKLRKAS